MAVLCVVLLALFAIVQVAHVHPTADDADHCPLCIVMHTAVPVTVAAPVLVLVRVGAPTPIRKTRPVLRHWHPTLFTRPPPVGC
jgi:hypothetical protein